jgi:hypothetical protein
VSKAAAILTPSRSYSNPTLIPLFHTVDGITWTHHVVPEADVLETKAQIAAMKDSQLASNGSVTTKPTIAYGSAAGLGQYPYMVSLQYVSHSMLFQQST